MSHINYPNQERDQEDRRMMYRTAREAGLPVFVARRLRDLNDSQYAKWLDAYVQVMNRPDIVNPNIAL